MAITKVGVGKWRVRVSYRDKRLGYPVSRELTVVGTKAEAQDVESKLLSDLKSRSLTGAGCSADVFSDLVEDYLKKLTALGASKSYFHMIEYLKRELGHVKLRDFSGVFRRWRNLLMEETTVRGKVRSKATVNRYTAGVRAIFGRAVAVGAVSENPITPHMFVKMAEFPRDRRLTQEEQLRLFATIERHYSYLMPFITYMIKVPCRYGELIRAKREQYNRFTNTVYIPNSKAKTPIHKPVPPELTDYFRGIPMECPWLFYRKTQNGYFPLPKSLKNVWKRILRLAEIRDFRIHDLRHEAATALYEAGNAERSIMDVAGWKTPMLSTYRHKDSLLSARSMKFLGVDDTTVCKTVAG